MVFVEEKTNRHMRNKLVLSRDNSKDDRENGNGTDISLNSSLLDFDDNETNDSTHSSKEACAIAIQETKAVHQVKAAVFLVLLIAMVGAISVYVFNKNVEEQQFNDHFMDDATKVLEAIGSSFERALGSLDLLAMTLVSIARRSNQSFPFVTIPEYGMHIAKTMPFTGAVETSVLPVVTYEQRRQWEEYAARKNGNLLFWVRESQRLQDHWDGFYGPMPQNYEWNASDVIYGDFGTIPYDKPRVNRPNVLLPEWHKFPIVPRLYPPANFDWMSIQYPEALVRVLKEKIVTISQPMMIPRPDNPKAIIEAEAWCAYYSDLLPKDENCMEPTSQWFYPVVDKYEEISVEDDPKYPANYTVKAILLVTFYWRTLFREILPSGSRGMILVVDNTCFEGDFTYQIDGPLAKYIGVGDWHDMKYDDMSISSSMVDLGEYKKAKRSIYSGLPLSTDSCLFNFRLYPSDEMKKEFQTHNGIMFALAAVLFIFLPSVFFIIYDRRVSRRQQKLMASAQQSNAIISSLYPANVRNQLYPLEEKNGRTRSFAGSPIADLYPETTVLFADIASFTAWSSIRDPLQVFTLLESVYGAFDAIAERRKVFKVETIGDCYVCVTGLPNPQRDHALIMTKFAIEIINEMKNVTANLDKSLGPGTSNLSIRVGLNSGPTTAGVLRGTKCRFQLFGDTVNTASRMESNSEPNKILCSRKTAELLIHAAKEHWITEKSESIEVKGKGVMDCFWVNPKYRTSSVTDKSTTGKSENSSTTAPLEDATIESRFDRHISWMTQIFQSIIQEILTLHPTKSNKQLRKEIIGGNTIPWDEVVSTMSFTRRRLDENVSTSRPNVQVNDYVQLNDTLKSQIFQYVLSIACNYRNHPFHNFDHAIHVVMSARKLLSRITVCDKSSQTETTSVISRDPLVQLAILLSALVHDVDHPGVSNAQLSKEKASIAIKYNNKSMAEQNSVSIAWDILMQPNFELLRSVIMPSEDERNIFRQILVNTVLSTDLFESDLRQVSSKRWEEFYNSNFSSDGTRVGGSEDSDLLATIVVENIIQASDVSHTMQHWHVYQEWNQKLFRELYTAHASGRSEKNPLEYWYDGELWFFDNYIIPLAKKLKTCGVFGVSCDELLDYAIDNRAEWAAKGKEIVAKYASEVKQDDDDEI